MKKTLYSLMLNDEVMREVDMLAHSMGTNRSNLVKDPGRIRKLCHSGAAHKRCTEFHRGTDETLAGAEAGHCAELLFSLA